MAGIERESTTYQCEKLGSIAHANVEYFHREEIRFILRFECDRAADCGIRRSPFSGSPLYTLECPLYITLEDKLNRDMPHPVSL